MAGSRTSRSLILPIGDREISSHTWAAVSREVVGQLSAMRTSAGIQHLGGKSLPKALSLAVTVSTRIIERFGEPS